jgi:hypothetical protein
VVKHFFTLLLIVAALLVTADPALTQADAPNTAFAELD